VQYAPFDRHSSAARLDSRSGATSVRPRRPAERHRPGFCRKAVPPALSGYDRGLSGNGALHGGQFQRQSLCAGDRPLGCALVCGVADQLPPARGDNGRTRALRSTIPVSTAGCSSMRRCWTKPFGRASAGWVAAGEWTRLTSGSGASGSICIGPSTRQGTQSISC
jgi:hypothetical protein